METKRTVRLMAAVSVLFVLLVVYMTYFQIFKADKIAMNSYNQRLSVDENAVVRGDIYDKNRVLLATSYKDEEGDNIREYLYPVLYAHVIGYNHVSYGKTGLELAYNNALLNVDTQKTFGQLKNLIAPTGKGNDLVLTIDNRLQERAYQQLEGHKGSIVLLNYQTGEVLAMAGRPSFNPMTLDANWDELLSDADSPLINRSTQGLYTPGSSFKVITAAAILENLTREEQIYEDRGETVIDGYTIQNYLNESFGEIDLETALINSVNTYFADKGVQVGASALQTTARKFMMNQAIPFDIPVAESISPFATERGLTEIAAASFGQGKTLVTPLQMALVIASIANEGKMPAPLLVDRVISPEGEVITQKSQSTLSTVLPEGYAKELKDDLIDTVNAGTRAMIEGKIVGGKTGTAETASGLTHAWFIAFLEEEDLPLAVAVVLEEDDSLGGRTAAPIAREMFLDAMYLEIP